MRRSSTIVMAAVLSMIGACGTKSDAGPTAISPRTMADALHAVLEADRAVYTTKVVNRLQNELGVIKASEHWQDDKALPLPAQMFRMGAELVAEKDAGFSYALLSPWPVNKQNEPKTPLEIEGVGKAVATKTPFYGEEKLGAAKFFTAIYPDVAVAPACITCHNEHTDSPKRDFNIGDAMGAVVIRIPLGD